MAKGAHRRAARVLTSGGLERGRANPGPAGFRIILELK
jgi:hypothetical protein